MNKMVDLMHSLLRILIVYIHKENNCNYVLLKCRYYLNKIAESQKLSSEMTATII